MAGYIPTRLVPILGATTLEKVAEEHLTRLIGVTESADLEFKQQTYGNNGEQTRELAYDVAAMANDVGGLLIIGIAETDGRATSLEGVDPDPFGEEEQLRIHKVVAARLFPPHRIEVQPVQSTSRPRKVFYVVSIPPSEWAPHAVGADLPSLRWPRRSGPGRRWMSESEIAQAYRRRHASEDDQIDRAYEIHSAVVEELPHVSEGWLVVTLMPNRNGHLTVSQSNLQEYENWLNRGDDGSFPRHGRSVATRHARADFRSIRFADGYHRHDPAYSLQGRMYTNGSGVLAARYDVDERYDYLEIIDEMVLCDVVNSLLILGQHAVDQCFTSGDGLVLADFWSPLGRPMVLTGQQRHGVVDQLHDSVRVEISTQRSRLMVSLADLASPGPGLLRAARSTVCDLMAPFGVPEPRQLSEEGAINLRVVTQNFKQAMKDWADRYGASYTL